MKKLKNIIALIFCFYGFCAFTHGAKKMNPDISINGMNVLDRKSIERLNFNMPKPIESENEPLPIVVLYSKNKKEKLILVFHPGSIENEFSEFVVEQNEGVIDTNAVTTDFKNFTTNNGIYIGSDSAFVVAQFQNIQIEKINTETSVLTVKIDDFNTSEFLKKYNMPVYYAKYWIVNQKVQKFAFGFEYP